jgi:hypothetical protein
MCLAHLCEWEHLRDVRANDIRRYQFGDAGQLLGARTHYQ